MAKLLVAGDRTAPNAVSAYLQEALPDDFIVVAEPVLHRCPLASVVVGPGGLTLIDAEEDPSQALRSAGDGSRRPGPTREQATTAAVRAFLSDEFPTVALPVHYLVATCEQDAELSSWNVMSFIGVKPASLAKTVVRLQTAEANLLDSPQARQDLATAVRDRRLTANQPATRPFVFRSGGLLRVGTTAWTVRAAVEHMDRHPADGVYHLCNDTLASWLQEQGAADLAALARRAVKEGRTDRRRALEVFLLGTGLVSRPRLVVRPKLLDLGYVLSGETAVGGLRLQRGRGRGYLVGSVESSAAWLTAEPKSFAGEPVDLTVRADTLPLLINEEAYKEALLVVSNASEEPVQVPVCLRVVAEPARLARWVHRPAAGLMLGAILGILIGWLWAQIAPALPAQITGFLRLPEALAWMLPVVALWALSGLIRGLLQPPAWPIRYATGRWFAQLARWAPLLALGGAGAAWWLQWTFAPLSGPVRYVWAHAALVGLALSTLPATFFSLRRAKATATYPSHRQVTEPGAPLRGVSSFGQKPRPGQVRERIARGTLAAAMLILALIFVPQLTRVDWAEVRAHEDVATAETWAGEQVNRLNAAADGLVDWLYLSYYDRRAPAQPTPAPISVPVPVTLQVKAP